MIACPRCATENPEGSRFCNNCGASLVARVGVQERRVVTALFADLARSTSLGERLDPEVVRGLVGAFFELARTEVERRGGSVEKFSGDAVMAVFGLPQAHEDDPERAVRAALAIHRGLTSIAELARKQHGIEVQARIGIESGEVVVGDPFGGATMATGDAMNLAARLEQQANPGDVVVGETAYASVRDLVTAKSLGRLDLRGHEAALTGWRVTSVADEVGRPRGVPGLQAPLTGRDDELSLLLDAGRHAIHERKAVLFSVLGTPGVGKSRLVREAVARMEADGAIVVRGRCLPYGEGITYWPAAEVVRELAGIPSDATPAEARERIAELAPDKQVAQRLAQIVGVAEVGGAADAGGDHELAWGMRRLVEHVAGTRAPLVLVFEDIHWAEPPLLDLIEYLATWVRDAPVFITCTSRPELLDNRAGWGAGRMEATRIMLEPLNEQESRALLGALLTVDDLPASLRQRVLDRAEGNPLFVEEVVRMLIEEGLVEREGDRWLAKREAAEVHVPDSVEALIRARLDTLPAPERGVLQAASVVGRVFQQSAVAAIAPEAGDGHAALQRHLEEAVLRDLISEERAPDEPTYRFRHILIRDVAYSTLPKARRAELHRAVADWLRAWAGQRIDEFVEILAYHLEQAVRLRRELGSDVTPAERDEAITALETSARRALVRDDARATRGFAERALALGPAPGTQRMEIEWLLADAHRRLNNFREAGEIGSRLEKEAEAAGRKDLQGRAVLARAGDLWLSLETTDFEAGMAALRRARELLTDAGDDRYLLDVLELMGYGGWWHGQLAESEEAWSEMRRVAHENGWLSREAEALSLVARVPYYQNDVETGMRMVIEARELAMRGTSRLSRARVERRLGAWGEESGLPGVENSDAEAERLLASAAAVFEEFGDREELNIALVHLGDIRMRQERFREALAYYQQGLAAVMEHGGYRSETQRRVAEALLELGDVERAAQSAEEAAALVSPDDVFTVASTSTTLALVRQAQGDAIEAERLLRHAAQLLASTDFVGWWVNLLLAELLYRQRRIEDAEPVAERARAEARRLGPHSPMIELVDQRLADARRAASTD
jgi:class 3 adenylate cyclase